jgi:hypothetical protein
MGANSTTAIELKPHGLKKKYALKPPVPKPAPVAETPLAELPPREPWPAFSDSDLLDMAHVVTKNAHFLDPSVIAAVVQDNQAHAATWRQALARAGVKPGLYLWEGSACCFPGIRRFEGADEKDAYSKKLANRRFPNALELDFNDYPKWIWDHVMGEIPPRFSLVHTFSFRDAPPSSGHNAYLPVKGVHGLFTCATNMVYMPNSLVTVVSISEPLRALLARRQGELYGGVSALVPPQVPLPQVKEGWDYESFQWAPCSGASDMGPFLRRRNAKMAALLGL